MPGAVIGEGRVLAGGFVPQRMTRISAGCSSAMAQLLAAGQMVESKLVTMCVQLLRLLLFGRQDCNPVLLLLLLSILLLFSNS